MDELSKKILSSAEQKVRDLKGPRSPGRPSIHEKLLPLNSAILQMMEKKISLQIITESIREQGIEVGRNSIRKFMMERFPDLYAKNYTKRAPSRNESGAGVVRQKRKPKSSSKKIESARNENPQKQAMSDEVQRMIADLENDRDRPID